MNYKILLSLLVAQSYADINQTTVTEVLNALVWTDFSSDGYRVLSHQPFYSNQDMDKAEVYKPPREHSIFSFFDSVVDTNVMREAHKFLAGQGFSPMDTESFKKQLSTFWFDLYSRCEASGNSGFENVSGGEVQDSDVIRFGNWYRFCQPQKQGRVDYKLWSQKQAPMDKSLSLLKYLQMFQIT
ncbi:hypothetical protein RB195_018187 [Necator americanus]|uniref:EndoU domain-containing protein n=1 Tax=Necator americanus TaxID=51031 RepID=A0ABR1CAU1_NECAM